MSELFIPISDHESSQVAGGMFTIQLAEVGLIPEPQGGTTTQSVGPNPTAIQIVNETDLDLSYGLNYGNFNGVAIAAGEVKDHFGNTELAAVGWDQDLRQPDIQLNLALLKPGYQYAFRQV